MEIKIVFDNYPCKREPKENMASFWGFSAVVGDKLLFDTGSNGRVLLKNLEKMEINPSAFKYLFISHPHWDHTGGIDSILEVNPNLTLFLPDSFSSLYIADLKKWSREVKVISNSPSLLYSNPHYPKFYSTRVMAPTNLPCLTRRSPVREHSLIIEFEKYGAIITGCAHPGVVPIVKRGKEIIRKPITHLIGGFHLKDSSPSEILKVFKELKKLGVEKVTPTHCSGEIARQLASQIFGKNFIEGGTGAVSKIS